MKNLKDMTVDTWIAADGRVIKVHEFEDEHLVNAIKWLRRNEMSLRWEAIYPIMVYAENAPDGAAMCAGQAIDELSDMNDEDFLRSHVPPYDAMVREAARRRLKI